MYTQCAFGRLPKLIDLDGKLLPTLLFNGYALPFSIDGFKQLRSDRC
jgi:hypothetical protein